MKIGIELTLRFPRLYAAASLKQHLDLDGIETHRGFSAALCRGLIEAHAIERTSPKGEAFSAALCRGLIEAVAVAVLGVLHFEPFSAALCRGLIEACIARAGRLLPLRVFRGFMPRPH